MITTLLKNDGKFVYEDYTKGKAAYKFNDLAVDRVHAVYRKTNDAEPVVYMVSASWFEERITLYAQYQAAIPFYKAILTSDDGLSQNFSLYVDLVLAKIQTKDMGPKIVLEGSNNESFTAIEIFNTAHFDIDTNTTLPEDSKTIGGVVRGYMLHPLQYAALNAAPAGAYAGAGNGMLSKLELYNPMQIILLTCTVAAADGGTFSVQGSVSGVIGNAMVNMPFTSPYVSFLLKDGSADFIVGDVYRVVPIVSGL